MQLQGSYRFAVSPERLWAALMDPEVMGACVPGVQSFTEEGDHRYAFAVSVKVGIVGGVYRGTLEALDLDPPHGYRMAVRASGTGADVSGGGAVALTAEDNGGTTLTFDGDVAVTGVLARVGQRMMGSVARQQLDRLFACLQEKAR